MTRTIWPVLGLVALLLVAGLARLRPDDNLLDLTPDMPGREALIEALGAFGLQAPMYVHVRAPHGADPDGVVERLDAADAALSGDPAIGRMLSGFDSGALDETMAALSDVAPLLVEGADPEWRRPEAVERAVATAVAQLKQPGTAQARQQILRDPYGWGTSALQQLGLGDMSEHMTLHRGRVLSRKLDAGFVALTAADAPGAAVDALASARRVAAELSAANPGWLVQVAGPGAHAAAGEATVRGDIASSIWLSCALLGLLFLVALRHVLAPIWMVVPAGLAVAAGMGVFGWTGWPLHSLTLAFASALVGLCVDFPIHLAAAVGAEGDGSTPREATWSALKAIARPATACAATSILAFLLLLGSTSPFLRELGLFGAVSLTLGVVLGTGVLAWVAATANWRLNRRTVPERAADATPPNRAAAAAGLAGLAMAAGLPFLALDGDPRSLQRSGAELDAAEVTFAEDFGDAPAPAILFVRGPDEAQVLEEVYAVSTALKALPVPPSRVLAATDGLPPRSLATAHCRALKDVDVPAWEATFDAAAVAHGLRAGVFAPFFRSLEALPAGFCPGEASVDLGDHAIAETPVLGTLRERFVRPVAGGTLATVVVSPPPGVTELPDSWRELATAHAPGSSWVFVPEMSAHAGRAIGRDVVRLGAAAIVLCFVLLTFSLGSWRGAILALLTPVLALIATAGAFGWASLVFGPVPAVGLGACVLVLGLGIDDGIYVVHALTHEPGRMPAVRRAVVLTTLTSLIGFGVLALADSPGLAALGRVAAVGLLMDLAVALFVLPAVHARWRRSAA